MNRVTRVTALFLAFALTIPAVADSARTLFNKGRKAEAAQDYVTAYENYNQAYEKNPRDIRLRGAAERTKFLAAATLVHKGQLLVQAGKLDDALANFERAVRIDPSNSMAQQEVLRTRKAIEEVKGATGQPPRAEAPMNERISGAATPVQLADIPNLPITLRITEDTRIIYETIGKLAGINVLFDPDYTSRRIKVELNNVSLEQALEIVALESKTFWRPVTQNTIFIAADTQAKRRELEQQVVRTFYLSNISGATDLQDIMNVLRLVLDLSRVSPLPSQGALIARGTPDQLALAEKLIADIDKAKPEVVIEVAVLQVRRDRVRTLGIRPATTASVSLQPNITTTTGGTTTGTTTGTTGTTTNNLTLNKLANLDARDFAVTLDSAAVSFLMTDSSTRIIQNPQIRALDSQKASLKIGDRVPVATGSFQPGIGGVGINPLVNTQFNYIDVGVNIDITPRVHANREITLKILLDISSVTGKSTIGGIDQPIIGQRKVEHEIRLKEGEVNLLGGIFEESDQIAMEGWPFISQVPILKYLFSRENKTKSENEIIFLLTPRIVRAQDISELNLRPIDIGMGAQGSITLRRSSGITAPAPQPAPVQPRPAQPAPQQQTPQTTPQTTPPTPGPGTAQTTTPSGTQTAQTQPAQNPAATAQTPTQPAQTPEQPTPAPVPQPPPIQPGMAALRFDPATVTATNGSTFAVNVMIRGGDIFAVPVQIQYDPKMLQLVNASNGDFLSKDGQPVALVHRDDPQTGTLQVSASRPPGATGMTGEGTAFTLTFLAKTSGNTTLTFTRPGARTPTNAPVSVTTSPATINIR